MRQTQTNLAPKIDLCHLQCGAKVRQYARVRVQLEVKDGPRLTGDSPNCINEPTSLLSTLFWDNTVPFIYLKKTYPHKKYCLSKQIQTPSFGSFKVWQLNTTLPNNLSHSDTHLYQAGMSQIIGVLVTRCVFNPLI